MPTEGRQHHRRAWWYSEVDGTPSDSERPRYARILPCMWTLTSRTEVSIVKPRQQVPPYRRRLARGHISEIMSRLRVHQDRMCTSPRPSDGIEDCY